MIFAASGRFRSSASERLPRFVERNRAENSPDALIDCRLRRVMSPPSGSILMTSAPDRRETSSPMAQTPH
jgi:hypothetical protein